MAKTEVSTAVKSEPVKSEPILGWDDGKPGWIEAEYSEGDCMECGEARCRCDLAWMNTDCWEVLGL